MNLSFWNSYRDYSITDFQKATISSIKFNKIFKIKIPLTRDFNFMFVICYSSDLAALSSMIFFIIAALISSGVESVFIVVVVVVVAGFVTVVVAGFATVVVVVTFSFAPGLNVVFIVFISAVTVFPNCIFSV